MASSAPNIFIREVDNSQPTVINDGTNVFVAGFTPQGITDEPTIISSIEEFEEIFGLPTTPAEKYSHDAVKQLAEQGASLRFTRMPYGSGAGLGFSSEVNALIFPVIGVSAVEITPCEYFRNKDAESIKTDFPWLYNSFIETDICYGSANLSCPLNSNDETPGFLYIHNHPVQYNSIVRNFKFVVDADSSPEDLKIFQLRPTVSGFDTTYNVVTSFSLSSINANIDEDASGLSDDEKILTVDIASSPFGRSYNITSGLMSGQTVTGLYVSAGDVFGTFSVLGAPVLKFYNASSDVAATFQTSYSSLPALSAGATLSVVTTALEATTKDFLISFCGVPVEAGLTCSTISSLGLQVPEKDKYNFYPLAGDAQLNDANFYVLGQPVSKTLNATEYDLLQNEQFTWKCGAYANVEPQLNILSDDVRAGIIVVNEAKTAQLEDFTGYYLAINDNLNVNPSTNFDDITGVAGYYQEVCPGVSGEWIQVPEERWNFKVSETFDGTAGSISEIVENGAGIDFGTRKYNDSVIVTLFKLRPTRVTETINKLDQIRVEQFTGSLNSSRKINDDFGGPPRSNFIGDVVNNGSNYMKLFVNPYLSNNNCWNDNTGVPQKTVRMFREKTGDVFDNFDAEQTLAAYGDSLFGIGTYSGYCRDALYDLCQKKDIGNLPAKLERALRNVENPIEFPIEIVIDNGLSTIWATRAGVATNPCITNPSICYNYDDTVFLDTSTLSPYDGTTMNSAIADAWQVIFNVFDSFNQSRKSINGVGVFHIQDPLRQITVNGKDYKVVNRQKGLTIDPATNQPTEKYATFGRNIWTPLKNLYGRVNTSYGESHPLWVKSYDSNTDSFIWVGPSSRKAALYVKNDREKFPWTPPFGLEQGQLSNIVDIAFNPNQREMDLLSKIGLNPIVRFPNSGVVVWNSLTLQKEQSALQENYIRRGLIWLANNLVTNLRQFIGKPNNIITRSRVKSVINPILQFMKDNQGLYGFTVVCDERNNSATDVDNGNLRIAIYVSPTKAVKNVLVDLIINRSDVAVSNILL